MKKLFAPLLCLVTVLPVLFMANCTQAPVAGTETGNPEITACMSATEDLLETKDAWLPTAYLVNGEVLLNPEHVKTRVAGPLIAGLYKQQSSDAAVPPMIIVTRTDTLVKCDTSLVDDTLIVDTALVDSAAAAPNANDPAARYVLHYTRYDTMYVKDTIVRCDTFYLTRTDTTLPVASGGGQKSNVEWDVVDGKNTTADVKYVLVRDSATGTISLQESQKTVGTKEDNAPVTPPVSAEIRSGVAYSMISGSTIADGKKVVENYYFNLPGAEQAIIGWGSGSAVSYGVISFTDASSGMLFELNFDAGSDNNFATGHNNRIYSMQRQQISAGIATSRVTYGKPYFGTLVDTHFLQYEQMQPSDSVRQQVTKFSCVSGTDPFDHRQNRLASVKRVLKLANHRISGIEIDIVPASPVSGGNTIGQAQLFGRVDFGKGCTGRIDASISDSNKSIRGTWYSEGIEQSFIYWVAEKRVEFPRDE